MVNGNVRANMLQKIIGLLQELTEEAPDIFYIVRLINTWIGRIEVLCEHSATCPPDIPIGKRSKNKTPAGPVTVISPTVFTVSDVRAYNSWSIVRCGLFEGRKHFRQCF